METIKIARLAAGLVGIFTLSLSSLVAASPEWNPVRSAPVALGPEADRLVVGFRMTSGNVVTNLIQRRSKRQVLAVRQAQTTAADALSLAQRTGLAMSASRQLTPSIHVLFLQKTLYGADVGTALQLLRADPAVAFADVDERRYPLAMPNDPLFLPVAGSSSGQWYMQTPSAALPTSDAAATDAVSAWNITQGSSGTVIADVDSGILFGHPDLLRAGFGGRLLPGYDFVSGDIDRKTGAPLGTFLIANDGDGYDPDPSDPGDWVSATDLQNPVFPPADCGDPNNNNGPVDSSWHGTRVMGVLGALTDNEVGIAGMTWNPYLLPVRALGKCGGFDSDIIVGMQWAAGMPVSGVPDNPYPADIINLSLGGSGSCPSDYQSVVSTLNGMDVLLVASAGNASGPVAVPGNCPGVLAVAGLRNVGTKVGYSSLGPEAGIAAPAGNCVNSSGACLRSIDTTSNDGLTVPGNDTYTNETNVNLGTSFSAPIVSGIAALMRAVNANLTPAQLIARMQASASPFPQPPGLPQCPMLSSDGSGECACTTTTCGAGMVNALSAVKAALNPIAALALPANISAGVAATYDGSGSVAACGTPSSLTIASYQWTATGGVVISGAATAAQVMATWSGVAGTLTLVVTDSAGHSDTATIDFSSSGATTAAPSSPGTAATACTAPMTVTPAAPTIGASFAPASVATNATAVLSITLNNTNGFALTQSALTVALPANLIPVATVTPSTTCTGAALTLNSAANGVALANANIPAQGSCQITLSVKSAASGTYTDTFAVNALMTGPAGGNTAAASASLTVTAPSSGGGGSLDWTDVLLVVGVLLASRRHALRRPRR